MIPQFSMMISANPRMEFQTELFIRSLELFGECSHYFFDLFIPDTDTIRNSYIRKKVKIHEYKYNYNFLHPWIAAQPRWNIIPKSKICILADSDILITSKIEKILDYCAEPGFYACIANDPPFSLEEWRRVLYIFGLDLPEKMYFYKSCCGDFQGDKNKSVCPFYPNYGFVVVHSKYIEDIKKTLTKVVTKLNETHKDNYYMPQFAITIALQLLQIPTYLLPNDFNYITHYNYKSPILIRNMAVCHYNHTSKCINDLKYHDKLYEFALKLCSNSIKLL